MTATSKKSVRLVLFPGLGADERLFAPQRGLGVMLEIPRWPAPTSQRQTLSDYARRIAARIDDRGEVYLGGVSFGAMVALEAARHLRARAVFMIGGCTSHRQISLPFQGVCALGACMPRQWLPAVLRLAPPVLRLLEGLSDEQAGLITQMLLENHPAQTRWSAGAILRWSAQPPMACPIHSIHGELDEVIPLSNVNPDDVVEGGRHLISLTHPEKVNEFLAKHLLGCSSEQQTL